MNTRDREHHETTESPRRRSRRGLPPALALAALAALGVAGCSLPQAQSDPTRFFVLSATTTTTPPAAGDAPALQLRAVELATYLQTRAIVVRRGANELEFREFARWSEPLERGVARVLREELLARGAGRVSAAGVRAQAYDRELSVRVLACEGGAEGAVIFRAVWELTSTGGAQPTLVARGDFRPADLRWDGQSESALAAQLSAAVAGLAGDIALALKK